VVVRSADEYVRNDGEAEPDLAQADARVITLRSPALQGRSSAASRPPGNANAFVDELLARLSSENKPIEREEVA
jgi:hypothetical protein